MYGGCRYGVSVCAPIARGARRSLPGRRHRRRPPVGAKWRQDERVLKLGILVLVTSVDDDQVDLIVGPDLLPQGALYPAQHGSVAAPRDERDGELHARLRWYTMPGASGYSSWNPISWRTRAAVCTCPPSQPMSSMMQKPPTGTAGANLCTSFTACSAWLPSTCKM